MRGENRLDGQVAIVTGAGRGIGRAVGNALSRAGAAVAIAARSIAETEAVADEIVKAGGLAVAVPTDVTEGDAVDNLLARTEETLGVPTLLVNNAGAWRSVGPVAEADPATWWADVEVSLKGSFLCTRAVLPGMLSRGVGRIVNVSSYAAVAPRPYLTAYACAKAALLRFTDSLAGELEGSGVLAFAITPGFVRTELIERIAKSPEGRRFVPDVAEREDALDPEDAAGLVVEIASGRLDRLSGRFIHVLDEVQDLVRNAARIHREDLYALRMGTLSGRPAGGAGVGLPKHWTQS